MLIEYNIKYLKEFGSDPKDLLSELSNHGFTYNKVGYQNLWCFKGKKNSKSRS